MKLPQSFVYFGIGLILASSSVQATPYASGVTNLSGNGTAGGKIQFILNEPASVYVITYPTATSNSLGSLSTGTNSFSLGSDSRFAIYCVKAGSGAVSQLSSDANALNVYPSPRGVTVSQNPGDWRFGRIYVSDANSAARGIFCRNADESDAMGQGTTGSRAATLPFVGSSYSPWKLFVGPDGTLYIASTSTLGGGGFVGETDPDVLTGSLVLAGAFNSYSSGQNHSDICGTPTAFGSIAAGNLVLEAMDVDYPPGLSLLQWNIGSGPFPSSVTPTVLAASGEGVVFNPGDAFVTSNSVYNYYYILLDRSNPQSPGTPSLQIFNTNGTVVWDSFNDSITPGTDLFANKLGGAVSPDGNYIAAMDASGVAFVGKLTNGIPDETTFAQVSGSTGATSYGAVCWDAADNFYSVSSGVSIMRAYSLGLTTTCITSNDYTGTNGSFSISTPSVAASVVATAPLAYQASNSWIFQQSNSTAVVPAIFTLSINAPQSGTVAVNFSLGGTATNGVNYNASTNGVNLPVSSTYTVDFPPGATNELVTITPTTNPASGPTLTVTLTLLGGVAYSAVIPSSGTADIANSGPQSIAITSVSAASMYRGISNDFVSFVITRYGDTNAASYTIPTNAFTLTGTATLGVDYLGILSPIGVTNGDATETVQVSDPICTGVYCGNETIIAALNTNAGVSILGGTATMVLVDNADPPAPVLWSDTLQQAADSTNWTLTFANSNLFTTNALPVLITNYPNYVFTNGTYSDPNYPGNGGNDLDDFDVEFGYNATNDGVALSPMMVLNGWTNALKMTVNKVQSYVDGHGASAGVNVYPQGGNFSGNYAFRFSMCLTEGQASTTEYNGFGINHKGTNCNWFAGDYGYGSGTTNADGIWFPIDADVSGGGLNAFNLLAGPPLPNTGYVYVANRGGAAADFKNPVPYNGTPAGTPSDWPNVGANTVSAWADVEVKQVNNAITMSINKFPIMTYYNTNYASSGDIMLAYDDPFASVGTTANNVLNGAAPYYPGAGVFYVNARVVQLTPPNITKTSIAGTSLTITFTDSDTDDTASSFEVLSSSAVNGAYTLTSATFTQSPATGAWSAVVTVSGSPKFYKIVRI